MRFLLAVFLIAGLAGCAVAPVDPPESRPPDSGAGAHTCVGACDHIFVDGGWRVIPGHKHGPGCGHELVNGRWVTSPPTPPDDPAKKPADPK